MEIFFMVIVTWYLKKAIITHEKNTEKHHQSDKLYWDLLSKNQPND